MSPTQLSLYNGALRICGETKLANLGENREARSLLDDVWADGAINYCLELGLWNFAFRADKILYDPEQTPAWGYAYVFQHPTDWVRTAGIWQDETLTNPLTQMRDEGGFIFTNVDTIYLGYISNDVQFGNNLGIWAPSFTDLVEHYLAKKICTKVCKEMGMIELIMGKDGESGMYKKALNRARSMAAMNESTKFFPPGSWLRARWGRGTSRDQGSTTQLIG